MRAGQKMTRRSEYRGSSRGRLGLGYFGRQFPLKVVHVTFDEALLNRLYAHPAVKERGRSAVLREAAAAYLARKDAEDIAHRYRAGYGDASGLDAELEEWAGEGAWPKD